MLWRYGGQVNYGTGMQVKVEIFGAVTNSSITSDPSHSYISSWCRWWLGIWKWYAGTSVFFQAEYDSNGIAIDPFNQYYLKYTNLFPGF